MDIVRFDRWVRCVIRNKAYSYFRSRKRYYTNSVSLREEGWYDSYFIFRLSVDDFDIDITDGELYRSIRKLSDIRQSIIMLHYFVGCTDKETGEILNIPRTTVHYNRMQSLLSLRKEMGGRSATTGDN